MLHLSQNKGQSQKRLLDTEQCSELYHHRARFHRINSRQSNRSHWELGGRVTGSFCAISFVFDRCCSAWAAFISPMAQQQTPITDGHQQPLPSSLARTAPAHAPSSSSLQGRAHVDDAALFLTRLRALWLQGLGPLVGLILASCLTCKSICQIEICQHWNCYRKI